jgi:hypothetical protein
MHVINNILSVALLGNTSYNRVHIHQCHNLHSGHRVAVQGALSGTWSRTKLNRQHCSCSRLCKECEPGITGSGNTPPLARCEVHANRIAEILQYDTECSTKPMNYTTLQNFVRHSQSHIATDGRSVYLSWCRAHD